MRTHISNRLRSMWQTRITNKRSDKNTSAAAQEARAPTRAIAAAIAKWLIPSISALFVAVGYVIVSAHQNLLGIDYNASTSDYIVNASGFLYDLCTILPDSLIETISSHRTASLAAVVAGGLLWWGCRYLRLECSRVFHEDAFLFILILVVLAKFVVLDAPLARIENVLHESFKSGNNDSPIPVEKRLKDPLCGEWLDNIIYKKALSLWTAMVCSRVSSYPAVVEGQQEYIRGQDPSKMNLRGEFLAHSALSMVILALSLSVLRRTENRHKSTVAILASAYVLTWPYAYGKLEKSTSFRYGQIAFNKSSAIPTSACSYGDNVTNAMVLDSGPTTTKFLVIKCSRCSTQVAVLQPDQGSTIKKEVKLWEVPNSEIAAIREIYWEDVIAWKTRNETSCPKTVVVLPLN